MECLYCVNVYCFICWGYNCFVCVVVVKFDLKFIVGMVVDLCGRGVVCIFSYFWIINYKGNCVVGKIMCCFWYVMN